MYNCFIFRYGEDTLYKFSELNIESVYLNISGLITKRLTDKLSTLSRIFFDYNSYGVLFIFVIAI